jgi:hypothetical protein
MTGSGGVVVGVGSVVVVGMLVGVVTTVVGVVTAVVAVGVGESAIVVVEASGLPGVAVVGGGAVEDVAGPVGWVVAMLEPVEGGPIARGPLEGRTRGNIEPASNATTTVAAAAVPITPVTIRRLRSRAARRYT